VKLLRWSIFFSGCENVSWHLQSHIHLKGIWTLMLVEPCYMWFIIKEFRTVWQLDNSYANPLWPEASFMCTMLQAPSSGQLTTRNYSFFPPSKWFFDMLSNLHVWFVEYLLASNCHMKEEGVKNLHTVYIYIFSE
jgi:hypothetical protein